MLNRYVVSPRQRPVDVECQGSAAHGAVLHWIGMLWLALFFLCPRVGARAVSGEPVCVKLLPHVSVLGPIFTIGDVSQVSGNDDYRCECVRKVPVGKVPPADRSWTLNALTIHVALRKAGYAEGDVLVVEGESVVTTESQDYPLQNLLPLIRTDILKATGENPANVLVEPSSSFSKSVLLPKGKLTVELRPPVSGLYDGSVLYLADLSVDGRKMKTLPMRVTVSIERSAVVVTHRVERGEKFDEGTIELKKLTSGVSADSVTLMSQAVGKTAARAIFPGTALRFQDIADPPVIKRGQEVTCRGRKGNVEIEVMVKAMEDGPLGRVIKVQNTGSQKLLKARVVDENTVEAVAGSDSGQH